GIKLSQFALDAQRCGDSQLSQQIGDLGLNRPERPIRESGGQKEGDRKVVLKKELRPNRSLFCVPVVNGKTHRACGYGSLEGPLAEFVEAEGHEVVLAEEGDRGPNHLWVVSRNAPVWCGKAVQHENGHLICMHQHIWPVP